MAIVRELTTLLDFRVDEKGLNQYEAAANKLKEIGIGLGKLFGIVFAASKIFELADGLVHAGKEANILVYQLTRMARAGDDIGAAQQRLFQIAQNTGIEYTKALETYKEFLNESKELNVSQDQLLDTTENIFKALRLSAASPEAIQATMATFERSFRMGRMGRRQFGMLTQQAPDIVNALAEGLKLGEHGREQLEAMAKAGTLTAKVLIEGLGKPLAKLNADFAARPRKLGEAFNYAWNAAVQLSMQLWKLLSVNSQVAKGIIWLTDQVVKGLTTMTTALGGIGNVLQILEIALGVVFGPKLAMMLFKATIGMQAWTAATWKGVAANLAFAAGIVAAVVAITDIVSWVSGKKSFIGDFLGSFEDVMKYLKTAFVSDDFFAGFRGLVKLFQGDFKGALEEFKISIGDVNGLLGDMLLIVIALTAGFAIWRVLKFFGLITAITSVAGAVTKVGTAAVVATGSLEALNLVSLAGLAGGLGVISGALAFIAAGLGIGAISGAMNAPMVDEYGRVVGTWGGQPLTPTITPGQVTGQTAPGVGAVTTGDQNNTVNQTNNVTINATDPDAAAGALTKVFDNAAKAALDALARQARNAAPRTEAPAQ